MRSLIFLTIMVIMAFGFFEAAHGMPRIEAPEGADRYLWFP